MQSGRWTTVVLASVGLLTAGCTRGDEAAAGSAGGDTEASTPAELTPAGLLMREAAGLVGSRRYAEARVKYEQTAREAEASGERELMGEAFVQIARMHSLEGDNATGRLRLSEAAGFVSPDSPAAYGRYLVTRGVFEREEGDGELATRTFIEAYDFCMEHDLYTRAIDAAHHVAIAGDAEQKEAWALKGIAAAEAADDLGWLGPLWNNLGWDYVEAERYTEALAALEQARDYHYRAGNELSKLIADYSVGFALRKAGRLAEARKAQDDVLGRARKALVAGDEEYLEWVGQSTRELGELDVASGRTAAGLIRIREAVALLKQAGMQDWWPEMLAQYEARVAELEALR